MLLETLLTALIASAADHTDAATREPVPSYAEVTWQTATRDDMRMFEPYIGTFHSPIYSGGASGRRYRFSIDYAWYDRDERIVKYTLETRFPDSGEVRPLGEGFYFFDAVTRRIQVVGAFRDGRSGVGFMTPFDVESGAREVRILGRAPDGTVTDLRDTFQLIDADHWRNVTFVPGPDGAWVEVGNAIYERVPVD